MHTDLHDLLAKKVIELYPEVKGIKAVEDVRSGYLSQNVILRSGGRKLFLKQYRFDNIEKIKEIHRVKFFFVKGGIPIVLPVQNKEGSFLFESGGKFYSLFPFVVGKTIDINKQSRKEIESAGKMLAHIHLLSKNGYPDITQDYAKGWNREEFFVTIEKIKKIIEGFSTKSDFDLLALQVLDYKVQFAEKNHTSYENLNLKNDHLTHGDYHGQNVFVDDAGNVKYVFDLEKAEIAPRAVEVARSMIHVCFSAHFEAKNFDDARTYLHAYNDIYPLNPDELITGFQAYILKKVYSLWIEKEHYLKNNTRVDELLQNEFLTLRYCSEHFDEFVNKLLSYSSVVGS